VLSADSQSMTPAADVQPLSAVPTPRKGSRVTGRGSTRGTTHLRAARRRRRGL
jgi:hypothetical protein